MDNMLAHDLTMRPGGVTFIALLTNFSGLITIIVVLLGLFGLLAPNQQAIPPTEIAVLIIHGLLGVAYVIVASGLWRLRRWAFWSAIVISVLLVANYAFEFWQRYLATPITVGGLLLPIIVLLYFGLSRSARTAFGV